MPRRRGLRPARETLVARRKELGLSVREVAQRIGVSYQHLANIENGHNERASATVLANLAEVLRLQLEDVIAGATPTTPRPQPIRPISPRPPTHPPRVQVPA